MKILIPTIPSGYATKEDLLNKVDKVAGKSLISDTEIERLANITNYDDTEIRNLVNNKVSADNLGYKTITSPDISLLDIGLYIYLGDQQYITYGDVKGNFYLEYGNLLYFYKYNNTIKTAIINQKGLYRTSGSTDKPFSTWDSVLFRRDIPYFTSNDVKRWNNAVETMISSDTFNSVVIVDSLTDIEEEEGVLYLVRENSEPVRDYVTKPTMEMGDISTYYGTKQNSTSYCRTARYVYVHGKSSIVVSTGKGNPIRVLAYDENKTFMENWHTDSSGKTYNYKAVTDGGSITIPDGAYYIKVTVYSSTVIPLTITYNN